jgi:hypothetical protein
VDATVTMRAGADCFHAVEEKIRQEEGAEVIDGEGGLKAVFALAPL